MSKKITILFLCTGNSCRSQMAEGWARSLKRDDLLIYSAGIETHGLNPMAVKVMAEEGVDISSQHSQLISDLPVSEFDYVITVCGNAKEQCPYFPAKTEVIHQGFDDPPSLAAKADNEEESLQHYRRVSLEINNFITSFFKNKFLLDKNLHPRL